MPSRFTLGERFEAFIRAQVESGRYSTESEVIRDGLRLLEAQENLRAARLAELRSAVVEGTESGEGVPATAVFDRLERRYARLIRDA
jgi:antitoxin ParD1/3/4